MVPSSATASRPRPINQIFEGLVTTEPGGTETIPALAESWEASEDGLQWTFNLREGVTFHDGEPSTPKRSASTSTAGTTSPAYCRALLRRTTGEP